MSIVKKLLICEGVLDAAFFSRLTIGTGFTRKQAEGKIGIKHFARGATGRGTSIIVRDRDFDVKPHANAELIIDGGLHYLHRTCIENYLLSASKIHEWWQAQTKNQPWTHGSPPALESLQNWIEDSARALADYQAVRWALASLTHDGHPRIVNNLCEKKKILPKALDLQSLKDDALEVLRNFSEKASEMNRETFEIALDEYQQRFQQSSFWEQKDYLIWFSGKQIAKMMARQNTQMPSITAYFNWAVQNIDPLDFKDLRQLREICTNAQNNPAASS